MPLLVLLFILIPLAEVWLIIRVAGLAGWINTIGLLFVISVVGAFLVRREGLKAWRGLTSALARTRMPTREVVDAALVLVGGALLLTPGFFTDAVGLFCVLPPTRALVNAALRRRVRGMFGLGPARPKTDDGVIDVQVVDVRRDDEPPTLPPV